MEETRIPQKIMLSSIKYIIYQRMVSKVKLTSLVVIGTDYIGSCKSYDQGLACYYLEILLKKNYEKGE